MSSLPLICLPFAGAGASFFKDWTRLSGKALDVIPVQLPGREELIEEEPYRDVSQAVEGILPDVRIALDARTAVGLFGHSMGAVLAYHLAHNLERLGITVSTLVVSGSPGPWTRRADRIAGLSDAEFLAGVRRYAGYFPPALEDHEFRALMLPVLRADAEMHEGYVPASDEPLRAPILSVRGSDDDMVGADQAAEWRRATHGTCQVAEMAGGHMYLTEAAGELVRLIAATVGRLSEQGAA